MQSFAWKGKTDDTAQNDQPAFVFDMRFRVLSYD